jgi:surface polysaccharide O-acyltransferase-like enzyme
VADLHEREHGLDALRVFAFAVLIFYHSGMAFVTWGWHVQNGETSEALEYVMLFASRWRLPLLFFISGAGVAFSLRRRSFGAFAGERTVRLLVPLVFGMLVVVPPQIYFERLVNGVEYESYAAFHRTVFDFVPYPEGGALSWHHLWFVAYVFVYALVGIPLFAAMRRPAGIRVLDAVTRALERHRFALYLLPVPVALVMVVLGPYWPTTHGLIDDFANLIASFMVFLWGYLFARDRRLLDVVTARRRELLVVAVAIAVGFFAIRVVLLPELTARARFAVWNVLSAWFAMVWLLAFVGLARAHVTTRSRLLAYATDAVYPFYIVHQTITVTLVFLLLDTDLGVAPKLALVAGGTFAGSWLCYEIVRRVTPLRPLFGLKLRR